MMDELDNLEFAGSQDKLATPIMEEAMDYSTTREFTGKYLRAVGKRKTASAEVRLYDKGSGIIVVNGQPLAVYFPLWSDQAAVIQPLRLSGLQKQLDFSIVVRGGGKTGQAQAIANGIALCLLKLNPDLRAVLRAKGLVTRDARIKERKKPGLKRARRAPQWSKR